MGYIAHTGETGDQQCLFDRSEGSLTVSARWAYRLGLLVVVAVLSLFLLPLALVTLPSQSLRGQAANAATSRTCVWTLRPVDLAPGDSLTAHKKQLFADGQSEDLTQLFLKGQLVISYSDEGYHVLGTFDRNSYSPLVLGNPIGVQSRNQWGLSTRWTWSNPNFTKYHWLALWQC